jgi:hypothetical protein
VVAVSLLEFHEAWAWFVVIGNALGGLWALVAHRFPSVRSRALWWFIGLAQLTIFVQVTLGVIMVAHQNRTAAQFHMFYGFVAILAVAIIYSYRHQLEQYRYLLYGGGGLFLAGLGIRAMLVGQV